MYWILKRKKRRVSSVTKHYLSNKEQARIVILARVDYWNQFYNFNYNRIAIRNQKRCWGSCTSLKNLNFNYKLIFLPSHLQDYIIVHELCHLSELNHGENFWKLVSRSIPEYKLHIKELKIIEKDDMFHLNLENVVIQSPTNHPT